MQSRRILNKNKRIAALTDDLIRLNEENRLLREENEDLTDKFIRLNEENRLLRKENDDLKRERTELVNEANRRINYLFFAGREKL